MKKLYFLLFAFLLLTPIAYSHGDEEHSEENSYFEQMHSCSYLNEKQLRLDCYKGLCEPSYDCAVALVTASVFEKSAIEGMEVINDIADIKEYSVGDGHSLAHIVGRNSAKYHGMSGEMFMECPRTYNYGCQHGFFEYVLANDDSEPVQIAKNICEGDGLKTIAKDRFYCYHGVGHGFMMAYAYNFTHSLEICDTLDDFESKEGCYQGVFMENLNGKMFEDTNNGGFDNINPLLPCQLLDEKYKWQCYINHGPYVVDFYNYSLKESTNACLNESSKASNACMQSIALMLNNPTTQKYFKEYNSSIDDIQNSYNFCLSFPNGSYIDCLYGVIDNYANFFETDITKSLSFCSIAKENNSLCYERISINLNTLVKSKKEKYDLCDKFPLQYIEACKSQTPNYLPDTFEIEEDNFLSRLLNKIKTLFNLGQEETKKNISEEIIGYEDLNSTDGVIVEYIDGEYFPKAIEINKGDTVTWVNKDDDIFWPASNIHPSHEIYPEFDPKKPLRPGSKWSFTFTREGIWQYHDHWTPRAIGTVTVISNNSNNNSNKNKEVFVDNSFKYNNSNLKVLNESQDSLEILYNDEYVIGLLNSYKVTSIMASLSRIGYKEGLDCHERAHEIGRITYQLYGSIAFKECSNECHSGCRHGATEAYFKERGTQSLEDDLNNLCNNEKNEFSKHQCYHGVGHGLMAWANYDINHALKSCDLINSTQAQSSCYSGIFMENVVGGLNEEDGSDHYTIYLSDDYHMPCNVIDDKYVLDCYFFQSSRMAILANANFTKVSQECSKAPNEESIRYCFISMGRDISGINLRDPKKSYDLCVNSTENLQRTEHCLTGVMYDAFWETTQKESAIEFCSILNETTMQNYCFEYIINRSKELLTKEEQTNFCLEIPEKFNQTC